jgi:formylglycine-generating enzyme required for sulfatase activity
VVVEVRVRATPDPLAVIAELNRDLVAQQAKSGVLNQQVDTLTARLDRVESAQAELQRTLQALQASGAAAGGAAAVDVASLPARFTDYVDYKNERGDDQVLDLGYQSQFEMVLIPGDPAKGVTPFYAQTTEVTWEMFRAWSYCTDLEDPSYAAKMKEELLRPTPCYEDASRGHGFEGTAVLGVSRRNAEAFCKHVSELTGRPYRLWTDAEWRYVAEATGGVPKDPLAVAWLDGNCREDEWGAKMTMPVAKKPADKFGLHDFWGNVAEWVMDDEVFIRGGSYLVTADELTMDWRETESQDVWNETYPNLPKSLWWYRDRFDMGFRLVCDPVNIPEAK